MTEFSTPLFTTKILLGRRTFFFDVRKTKEDKPYVKITESSVRDGQKQRTNMMIFDSEMEDFKKALSSVFGFVETIR
jgi:hypothetical protein